MGEVICERCRVARFPSREAFSAHTNEDCDRLIAAPFVAAERERCAKIAFEFVPTNEDRLDYDQIARDIAYKIREGV
jgi:hypothetical protein